MVNTATVEAARQGRLRSALGATDAPRWYICALTIAPPFLHSTRCRSQAGHFFYNQVPTSSFASGATKRVIDGKDHTRRLPQHLALRNNATATSSLFKLQPAPTNSRLNRV